MGSRSIFIPDSSDMDNTNKMQVLGPIEGKTHNDWWREKLLWFVSAVILFNFDTMKQW